MSRRSRQLMGLAFVLAVVLNVRGSFAQARKAPSSKGSAKGDQEQSPAFDARSFANSLQRAQNGDRRAQTRVGVAFAKGEVVGKNPYEAVRWFSEAAGAGDPQAQHDLAMML